MPSSKFCRPYWLHRTQQLPSSSGSMPLSFLYRYLHVLAWLRQFDDGKVSPHAQNVSSVWHVPFR